MRLGNTKRHLLATPTALFVVKNTEHERLHTHKEYFFVEVTASCFDFRIDYNNTLLMKINNGLDDMLSEYFLDDLPKLPRGPWSILGLAPTLSDEQWMEIVDSEIYRGGSYNPGVGHYQSDGWTTFYKNYKDGPSSICIPNTPTVSAKTLLASLKLRWENTLILKKI